MFKKIVYGITLILLLASMLTLALNIKSEFTSSLYDEQKDFTNPSFVPASASAEIRFDPETYTFITQRGLSVGFRFNTTIELYDVTELFAWQVRVYFNNTLLNATKAHYHPDEPLHTVGGFPVNPVIVNDLNETHGYLQQGISALYPNYVNVTAEDYPLGIGICIIEFEVLMKPSGGKTLKSNLALNNPSTKLIWKDGGTIIPCTKKNGLYHLISANVRVPTDYPTIQAAINAAEPGNTIFVYNGTYNENVVVNKTVELMGQSADTVTINGSGTTVVTIENANDIIIDGFTITSGHYGIYIRNSNLDSVSNCIVSGNSNHGIYAYAGYGNNINSMTLYKNNVNENGGNGIYAFIAKEGSWRRQANNWIICYNNITGNNGNGIYAREYDYMLSMNNWIICYNNISGNNDNGVHAHTDEWPHGSIDRWIIYSNNITSNSDHGILANQQTSSSSINNWTVMNNNVLSNGEAGLYTQPPADYWFILGNEFNGNLYGIHLGGENNDLKENKINNNTYNFGVIGRGVHSVDYSNTINGKLICYWVNKQVGEIPAEAGYVALVDSANIIVRNLTLSNNEQGIFLARTDNITLKDFCPTNNIYGIYAHKIRGYTTQGLKISNNTFGLYLSQSDNVTIARCSVENNTYGIYLQASANNTIHQNIITENEYGVYLYDSSTNAIHHNNFVQNGQQVVVAGPTTNNWNLSYPSGGNYWSDYTGPDECRGLYQNETGSDGIVDSNMTIDQNNIDYYPLSAPWSSPISVIMPGNTTYREISHGQADVNLTFMTEFTPNWIGYSLDGKSNVTITGNTTLTSLSYGSHHIVVFANDTLGNMYSSAKTHFTITFLTDLNYDKTVDISDLAMACYAYGSMPGDPRWKCKIDVNRDGIIDIEDIALIANDYGKTWP